MPPPDCGHTAEKMAEQWREEIEELRSALAAAQARLEERDAILALFASNRGDLRGPSDLFGPVALFLEHHVDLLSKGADGSGCPGCGRKRDHFL